MIHHNLDKETLSSVVIMINEVNSILSIIGEQKDKCKNILKTLCDAGELIQFCSNNPGIMYEEFSNGLEFGIELTNTQVLSDMTFLDNFVSKVTK